MDTTINIQGVQSQVIINTAPLLVLQPDYECIYKVKPDNRIHEVQDE